jgi:hypothetical protein
MSAGTEVEAPGRRQTGSPISYKSPLPASTSHSPRLHGRARVLHMMMLVVMVLMMMTMMMHSPTQPPTQSVSQSVSQSHTYLFILFLFLFILKTAFNMAV